jgi:hypothetical protein
MKIMTLACVTLWMCMPLGAAPLTQSERDQLLAQLEKSSKTFLASLDGVSEGQWNYKPAADRWSIAECAEHVVTADQMMFVFASQQLVKMPAPDKTERRSDDAVTASAKDRSKKVKTAEFLEPKGRYHSRAEVIAAFQESRAKVVEYVKTTQDDLRGHGIQAVSGYTDGYQFLLSLSAHAERHAQQIAEVKADPHYPSK